MTGAAPKPVRNRPPRKRAPPSCMKIDTSQGAGKTVTLQFGSVTLKTNVATPEERARNVAWGQAALQGIKAKLVRPGIKLRTLKGVPLFFADPTHPRRVVRELDGKREVGIFENGVFKTQG